MENIISDKVKYVITDELGNMYMGHCDINTPNFTSDFRKVAVYTSFTKADSIRKGLIWRYGLEEYEIKIAKLIIKIELIEE